MCIRDRCSSLGFWSIVQSHSFFLLLLRLDIKELAPSFSDTLIGKLTVLISDWSVCSCSWVYSGANSGHWLVVGVYATTTSSSFLLLHNNGHLGHSRVGWSCLCRDGRVAAHLILSLSPNIQPVQCDVQMGEMERCEEKVKLNEGSILVQTLLRRDRIWNLAQNLAYMFPSKYVGQLKMWLKFCQVAYSIQTGWRERERGVTSQMYRGDLQQLHLHSSWWNKL